MRVVVCDSCLAELDVEEDDLGHLVKCPVCAMTFTAKAKGPPPAPAPIPPARDSRRADPTPKPKPSSSKSIHVPVVCTNCRGSVDVHRDDLGFAVDCPLCGASFLARASEEPAEPSPRSRPRNEEPEPRGRTQYRTQSGEVPVRCPECDRLVDVDERDIGFRVRCPLCNFSFHAREAGTRRSYASERDRERRPDPAYALQLISPSANGMLWSGWIGAALFFILAGGLILLAVALGNKPGARAKDDAVVAGVYGVCFGVFFVPIFLIIGIAGSAMKRLQGSGWAYTGGIMAVIALVIMPVSPPNLIAGIFGIMALVAINKREVQAVIRMNQEGGAPRSHSYDD